MTDGATLFLDEDNLVSDSAVAVASQQSIKAYIDGATSLGTLTALQVDNININGNAITSTAGTDLTITPLAGQQIVLDGAIVIDAGVVTGATSITSTAFVGDITGDVTGTADVATVATTVTITDNESTDESNAIIFTAGGDVDGGNIGLESDGTLTYNPSTGKVTATGFVGALTGNVTGNASGTALTVTQAAQTAITSVGTLTALQVDSVNINAAAMTGVTTIQTGTTDGSDNGLLQISGGGAAGSTRGGYFNIYGNENGATGKIQFHAGNVSGGDISFYTQTTNKKLTVLETGGITVATVASATPVSNTLYADSIIKGWCHFSSFTTPGLNDDVNVISLTDQADGNTDVVWDLDFSGSYAVGLTSNITNGFSEGTVIATTHTNVRTWNASGVLVGRTSTIIAVGDN